VNDNDQVIRAGVSETEEYLIEALRRHPWKIKNQWVLCGTGAGVGIVIGIGLSWVESRKRGGQWWIGIPIVAVVLGMMFYQYSPAALRRQIRREARKKTGPPAQTTFEFRPDGFTATEKDGKTAFYPWPAIRKAVLHVDGFHLYFSERSFVWVPLKAFASHQDFMVLQERIRSRVQNIEQAEK
jgi:hypothetical protein